MVLRRLQLRLESCQLPAQLVTTGELDVGAALLSAAGAGFAEFINPQLIESATNATSAVSSATTAGEATSALNDILSMAAPGGELVSGAGTLNEIFESVGTILETVLTADTILDNIENNNGTPDLINPGVVLEEDEITPDFEGEYDENGNLIFNPDDVQVNVGNFDPDKVDDDDGGGGGGNTGDPTPEEIQAAEEAAAAEAAAQAAAEAAAAEAAAAQTAAEEAEDQDDLNGENTFPDTTKDGTVDINGNPIVVDGTVIVTDGNETEDQYIYRGDGRFEDMVDGDIWYIPDVSGVEVGDAVNEDYMVINGATVYQDEEVIVDQTNTDETEAATTTTVTTDTAASTDTTDTTDIIYSRVYL